MAAYLGFTFLDAAEVIRFQKEKEFNEETTVQLLAERVAQSSGVVIPGFYGATEDGTIVTFSRGGSRSEEHTSELQSQR